MAEQHDKRTSNDQTDNEILKYHRAAGLAITPVMDQLGYKTEVEIDISMQSQLIDIISVRRKQIVKPALPPIYWEVFGQLNEHNLFSFKSYRVVQRCSARRILWSLDQLLQGQKGQSGRGQPLCADQPFSP